MADTSNLSNYLKDLADAIRGKKGTEEQIPAANFDTEILSIETGLDAEPIYATTDYRTINISSYIDSAANINGVYVLDNWYLIRLDDNFYLFKKENDLLTLIGDVNLNYASSRMVIIPGIVGYTDNKIYIYFAARSGIGTYEVYEYDLLTNTTTLLNSGNDVSIIGYVSWSNKDGYFIPNVFSKVCKLDFNTYEIKEITDISGLDTTLSHSFPAYIDINKTQLTTITVEDDVVVKQQRYNSIILGVNYYKNKIFLKDGIYVLSDNLILGEKLNDIPTELKDTSNCLLCYNDKYYAIKTDNNYILYSFDESTNVLTSVEELTNVNVSNVSDSQINLYTDKAIYDFTTGNTLIGYKINGQSVYLNQSRNITTDKILSGYTSYSQDGSPISGTMPNNGELNYNSSTEEQTIPAGYTSGGTIAPAPLTDTEYDECLELSEQILGENVSL